MPDSRNFTLTTPPGPNGRKYSDADPDAPRVVRAYDARFMTDASFAAADFRVSWLARRLLVRGQPGVIGGPKKGLKTNLLVDLALSLGTGGMVLGTFPAVRCQVGILSGESGEWTLQETRARIARSKGIQAADVVWSVELPQLGVAEQVLDLVEQVVEFGIEVLFIDPLYLCFLAGVSAGEVSASNFYQTGPLFKELSARLLAVGCTPILVHHYKLTRADHYAEPQLDDLAYSGIQEFVRQWILLGRREKYQPGTGIHRLWLSAGGSVGHGGLWAVDIDEGQQGEDFTGRKWDVTVQPAGDVRRHESEEKADRQREKQERKDTDDDTRLLAAVDKLATPERAAPYTQARDLARLNSAQMLRAVARLVERHALQEATVMVSTGRGGKVQREVRGLRRPKRSDGETARTDGTGGSDLYASPAVPTVSD